MAKCKVEDCNMRAQVSSGNGLCINHDPTLVEEKRRWSAKGGRASRKVEPADVPSLRQLLADLEQGTTDDILQVKRVLVRAMGDLLDGRLSPTQFRALCSSGVGTLKDILALDFYRQLTQRVERLEGGGEALQLEGGDKWQESRLEDY